MHDRPRDSSQRRQVPLARPNISEREIELVTEVLRSDTLALGPFAPRFEAAIGSVVNRREAMACSSGTAGLHMCVRALGIGRGDEVLTSPFSFVSSANCLLYEGAIPKFVDIEEDSLGMDPDRLDEARSSRTRAILPVHVFGRPCRIERLSAHARKHGWANIEDACEGLGSTVGGTPLGGFGDMAVFAFYPNKQITTGEGGMVVTDDAALAEAVRSMRNQGRDADGTWLRHVQLGFNYRLDEMSAALGVAQMERIDTLRKGRQRVVEAYESAFAGKDWVTLPQSAADETVDWFVYVVRLHADIDRDRVMAGLAEHGVASRPYFSPIHLQPLYRETFGYRPGDFPVTERVAASTLALPFSSVLSNDDVMYVAEALAESIHAVAS